MLVSKVAPSSFNNQSTFQKIANKVGSFIPKKLSDTFEMTNKGSFDRIPLFLVGLLFVLGVRFLKSRDNHERREVLTRDGITVGSTFFAVPIIKNWISRGLDKSSKIPTASNNKALFSLDDFSMDNLKNWYSKADVMPEQALTMAKNISERGGDVATAFSKLGKETVDNLKAIAGNDLSNTNVLKALEKAYKSAEGSELKTAFGAITRALTPSDNALVKSAQTLKAIPNLASMILATAFLGWGIPAFNIYFTRNKLKNNKAQEVPQFDMALLQTKLTTEQKNIINAFLNAKA